MVGGWSLPLSLCVDMPTLLDLILLAAGGLVLLARSSADLTKPRHTCTCTTEKGHTRQLGSIQACYTQSVMLLRGITGALNMGGACGWHDIWTLAVYTRSMATHPLAALPLYMVVSSGDVCNLYRGVLFWGILCSQNINSMCAKCSCGSY